MDLKPTSLVKVGHSVGGLLEQKKKRFKPLNDSTFVHLRLQNWVSREDVEDHPLHGGGIYLWLFDSGII